MRARKVCSTLGCPNSQPCPDHERKPWTGSTRRKRLPRGWPRLRATVLYRQPTCNVCKTEPSTEVDHVVPGDDHSLQNLQGICKDCHREKTQRESAEARR